MYPKTPGCFSDLSAALYYKSYCFFLKLLIVLPVHFPLLHFTPPKVLRFYYNLTFRCVRYFGGSANLKINDEKVYSPSNSNNAVFPTCSLLPLLQLKRISPFLSIKRSLFFSG